METPTWTRAGTADPFIRGGTYDCSHELGHPKVDVLFESTVENESGGKGIPLPTGAWGMAIGAGLGLADDAGSVRSGHKPLGYTMSRVRVQGSEFRVRGSGFRVPGQGSGVRGQGSEVRGHGVRVRIRLDRRDQLPGGQVREHATWWPEAPQPV